MLIMYDSNEQDTAPQVIAALKAVFGADALKSAQLACGDLAITLPSGLLLIERKTPSDLLSSIADGRLFRQADGMVKAARFALVCVTGQLVYTDDGFVKVPDTRGAGYKTTHWRASSVRGALRAVQWSGCAVEITDNYVRTVEESIALAQRDDHTLLHRQRASKPAIDFFGDGELVAKVDFLAGLPGVGPKRAKSLLEWCAVERDGTTVTKLGTLASALEWATSASTLARGAAKGDAVLPANWTSTMSDAIREFLGLREGEHLIVTKSRPK